MDIIGWTPQHGQINAVLDMDVLNVIVFHGVFKMEDV